MVDSVPMFAPMCIFDQSSRGANVANCSAICCGHIFWSKIIKATPCISSIPQEVYIIRHEVAEYHQCEELYIIITEFNTH